MIFNGAEAWFIPPTSRYGLSRVSSKELTNKDFTFLATVKINWDAMDVNDITHEAGILIKNGKHLGISACKTGDNYRVLKAQIWTYLEKKIEKSEKSFLVPKPEEIFITLNQFNNDISEDYLNIAFAFDSKNKKFTLSAKSVFSDVIEKEHSFENELIDYTNSWLWVGCSNPLDSCPEDHRQYFNGEINYVGIFQKFLLIDEITDIFKNNWSKENEPICVYDFERNTPYKVLDITLNGNNLIKYDKAWMDSI